MIDKKIKASWVSVHKAMNKRGIKLSFQINREYNLAKDEFTATPYDNFLALSIAIRDRIVERWIMTQQEYHKKNVKRVYYISMEYLIGRLLEGYVYNFGMENEVRRAVTEMGFDYSEIREQELDAGLGNGGLGRLAACFLDSMATLAIPSHGYGIRYDYGIFNQVVKNGYQEEHPDEWLRLGSPWEFARPEKSVKVRFYGRTVEHRKEDGRLHVHWIDTEDVLAVPYDTPVLGYKNNVVNTLRLWSARSTEEFDLDYFQDGDYDRAVYKKIFSENISKVLYPNDSSSEGKELRLKQEYFLTASTIADIIRRHKVENTRLEDLAEKAAIQLNDTHPSLAIVELMRIFIDDYDLNWDKAWGITQKTFAYTNHTLLPEALETWSVELFQKVLPRHLQIIYEINHRFLNKAALELKKYDQQKLQDMSIINENPKQVRMAHLSIVGSHSVNGVSALHSKLVKENLFKDFYELFPEKFNNKTNGITQRQWLLKTNNPLSHLITETIGDRWITHLEELQRLKEFQDDPAFLEAWRKVKHQNKKQLAHHIQHTSHVSVDPHSMFDVQVKRMHEYKRQLLFTLYIISQYLTIKNHPEQDVQPRTFIIGGKAAPAYTMAKLIIKLINNVADVINRDKAVNDKIRLVFLENYRVSLAEKIFPASDLSEQISTAGMEASGTGNMKFMLNGALTIGTLDGANIEIAEQVGDENIFIFGLQAHEVEALRAEGYDPQDYIQASPMLSEILRLMKENFFSSDRAGLFDSIVNALWQGDYFMVCADFEAYCATQAKASELYQNADAWAQKSIINVAQSGVFSSDRTIQEYAQDIWKVPVERDLLQGRTLADFKNSTYDNKEDDIMGKKTKLEFELDAPDAQKVFLAGDFTAWREKAKKMRRSKDGVWKTSLSLEPGRYEYKFVVDENWWTDPSNPNSSQNEYGEINSVREIDG